MSHCKMLRGHSKVFFPNEKFIVGKKTTSQTRKRLREILFLRRTAFHVYFRVTQRLLYTFLPHFSPARVSPNSEPPEKEIFSIRGRSGGTEANGIMMGSSKIHNYSAKLLLELSFVFGEGRDL